MSTTYTRAVDPRATPPTEPLPGRTDMVVNSAGGYVWRVDEWDFLVRFLVLGTEGGTYYATERELTLAAIEHVRGLIAQDGVRVVAEVVAVSTGNRAPRVSPAIFTLAACSVLGDEPTKAAANAALHQVCRTGSHLLEWAGAVRALSGKPPSGGGQRRALGRWYNDQEPDRLAYQLVKYGQRGGWSQRDLLRLAHPKPRTPQHARALAWATGKPLVSAEGDLLDAVVELRSLEVSAANLPRVVDLVSSRRIPREAVPSRWLAERDVWLALLVDMPLGATVRNLGKLSSLGLLAPLSGTEGLVAGRLRNADRVRGARLHPATLLNARQVYASGRGLRGSLTWQPSQVVLGALDDAFWLAVGQVVPTGKRVYLAIDGSGSMCWDTARCAGMEGLRPVEGAAAMALVVAHSEERCYLAGFDDGLKPLSVTRRSTVSEVVAQLGYGGGTDASVPFRNASAQGLEVDAFVVFTDNETWSGPRHPMVALREYRDRSGIPAKLVVCSMVGNDHTFADPHDGGAMDVVGFDAAAPTVIADFVRGEAVETVVDET